MQLPTDPLELATLLGRRLDGAAGYLSTLESYFEGIQSGSFMSQASLDAMGGRLPRLGTNICRLSVLSLAERLKIIGFRIDGAPEADPAVWESWQRSGMDLGSDCAHVDSLALRRAYIVCWTDEYGDPLISAESPSQCTTINDPVRPGRALVGLKKWTDQEDPDNPYGQGHAVLYLPDRVISFETDVDLPIAGLPALGGSWHMTESLPNPAGECVVVPLINSYGNRSLDRIEGSSEMDDLMSIQDGLAKLAQDMLVSSELAARPRRWATGLELILKRDPATGEPELDADGQEQFVNPFSADLTRIFQSESTETKFGQFPAADLSPYSDAIRTLTEQASAVSCLPGHYLGIAGDQPPSADSIRAAEASLTSRAIGKIRMFSPAWARVAALEIALRTGVDPRSIRSEPLWSSPETRTPSQEADEATKLSGIGVPLATVLSQVLGWTPEQVDAMREAKQAEAPPPQPPPPPQLIIPTKGANQP